MSKYQAAKKCLKIAEKVRRGVVVFEDGAHFDGGRGAGGEEVQAGAESSSFGGEGDRLQIAGVAVLAVGHDDETADAVDDDAERFRAISRSVSFPLGGIGVRRLCKCVTSVE